MSENATIQDYIDAVLRFGRNSAEAKAISEQLDRQMEGVTAFGLTEKQHE